MLDIVSKSLCWETPLYKYLYANGCSWVDGDELQDRTQQRFSKLLCNDLNLEEINEAISACSNETIIKNTMDWIYKNEKLINETIFIIGFTAESRSKFDWDFYDILYTFKAFKRGLKNLVIPIQILHNSGGEGMSKDSWIANREAFVSKFTDHLPASIR